MTGILGKRAIHVSLHSTQGDAEQTREAVVEDLKARKWTDIEPATIWWCISLRSGEQTIKA